MIVQESGQLMISKLCRRDAGSSVEMMMFHNRAQPALYTHSPGPVKREACVRRP
jgi:hypothetical protein